MKCTDFIDQVTGKVTRDCSGLTGKAYKTLAWGSFLNAVINFVIVAFVVFGIVKVYKKAAKRQLATDGPTEVDLLTEIRDQLKARDEHLRLLPTMRAGPCVTPSSPELTCNAGRTSVQ